MRACRLLELCTLMADGRARACARLATCHMQGGGGPRALHWVDVAWVCDRVDGVAAHRGARLDERGLRGR